MDMVDVQEQFGAPRGEQLTHPQKINRSLKVTLRLPQRQLLKIILKLLENNEQLGGNIINRIKKRIHEVLGDLIVQAKQLHPQLVKEIWTGGLFDILLINNLLKPLPLRQSQNILRYMPQINILNE